MPKKNSSSPTDDQVDTSTSDVTAQQLKVSINNDAVKALYADTVILDVAGMGITLNFAQHFPGAGRLEIVSRIALSPQHAKVLAKVLADNVHAYEERFGKIEINDALIKDSKTIGLKT